MAPLLGLDGEARYGLLDLTPAQQRARTMQALAERKAKLAEERKARRASGGAAAGATIGNKITSDD